MQRILSITIILSGVSAFGSSQSLQIASSKKCVDVAQASSAAGAVIQQYECNSSKAQLFNFVKQTDGSYEIRTQTGTGLCLDIAGASSANLTSVQQYACNGTRAQHFDLRARDNGYEIRSGVNSSSCLDVSYASLENGAKLIQYTCNGGKNQLFQFVLASASAVPVTISPSAFSLTSPASGAKVSNRYEIKGQAGSNWKNIAAYDMNNNYAKIAVDAQPTNNAFVLNADSSLIRNGQARLAIIAFSVPAGSQGGVSQALELDLVVDNASGSSSAQLPAPISKMTNYVSTFDERFDSISTISLGDIYNGAKWYNGTEQCCMVDSTGLPGVMFPTAVNGVQVNPYSILPGGGLGIALEKKNNVWYSGVLTSVDKNKKGFAQKYGYFEMQAQLPAGDGVWPAFWMLSADPAMPGEIDIMEYYGHDNGMSFGITLHDWRNGGNNDFERRKDRSFFPKVSGMTSGVHKYGMLWTETTMIFYYDDQEVYRTATPDVMKQPYYFLVNNGLGGYWPTQNTPASSRMKVLSIRAFGQK